MHATLTTWQLRTGEDLEQLIRELGDRLAAGAAELSGHVAGYAVQVAPDRLVSLNVYEDTESAEVAAHALSLAVLEVMAGHAEVVERQVGPAVEIVPSARGQPGAPASS
jgi:ribosomal protein L16/L10AE